MNTVYKSASEAAALLHERYDGPMKGVQGSGGKTYDYIPWNESARQLDKVFGIFGWDSRVVAMESHPAAGIYTAAVEVTARVLDDETGNVISITRGAVGRGSAQPSKYEKETQGLAVAANIGTHDTAAATAGSDAFSRACKLLGDAFGLFLYDKDTPQTQTNYQATGALKSQATGQVRQAPATPSTGRGPSPKQMNVLLERGYTEQQIAGLAFPQWKGILDAIFDKREPSILPDAGTMSAEPQEDEIPF